MIEIKRIRHNEYELRVDDVVVEKELFYVNTRYRTSNKNKNLNLSIHSQEFSRKLMAYCFNDLPAELAELKLQTELPLLNPVDAYAFIEIIRQGKVPKNYELYLTFTFNTDSWKHLWSITEYKKELSRILKTYTDSKLKWVEPEMNFAFIQQFKIKLPVITDNSLTIESAVNEY